MSTQHHNRLFRPETLTALGIMIASAGFLIPTAALQPISALLPTVMLVSMIVLSVILLIRDQRKASAGDVPEPLTDAPKRVALAFFLIIAYVISIDFLGFYVSTAVSVPLVAYVFGYRKPTGLLIATAIVVGMIYLIFDFGMSREFPMGQLWSN